MDQGWQRIHISRLQLGQLPIFQQMHGNLMLLGKLFDDLGAVEKPVLRFLDSRKGQLLKQDGP